MHLRFVRLIVSDQDRALVFYTKKLGFIKQADLKMGHGRFLTVAAPQGIEGVQLILEACDFPPARTYQQACHEAGRPALSINTEDLAGDHAKLTKKRVRFVSPPDDLGPILCATFDDTCGNLISLVQTKPRPV